MKTGLLSITFRKLSAEEVIKLVVQAGLDGIEWGGDVHCPPDNPERAAEIAELTRKAGLEVLGYGSYYRVQGLESGVADSFGPVLETAKIMGAPLIRIWPGTKGSEATSLEEREKIVAEAREIAQISSEESIVVASEYHGGTLTDNPESALQFLKEVNHTNFKTLWQPINGAEFDVVFDSLESILPYLEYAHVFHWMPDFHHKFPLAEGRERWMPYLKKMFQHDRKHHALMEFVKDESPNQFLEDAATLKSWVRELEQATSS